MNKFVKWIILIIVVLLVIWALSAIIGAVKNKSASNIDGETAEPVAVESVDVVQAIRGVKGSYKDDTTFQQCVIANVDSCINQAIGQAQQDGEEVDIALCDDYLSDTARTNCRTGIAMNQALTSGDGSACNVLDGAGKATCLGEVAMQKGLAGQTLDVCNDLGDAKNNCVNRLAERLATTTRDAKWCDALIIIEEDPENPGASISVSAEDCRADVAREITNFTQQEADRADQEREQAASQAEAQREQDASQAAAEREQASAQAEADRAAQELQRQQAQQEATENVAPEETPTENQ